MTGRAEPAVSVVVCTYNRAAVLGNCLAALQDQRLGAPVQVVVVIDGSTDDSRAIAERFGAEVVLHEHNLGLSAARNSGIDVARAPIVAFTDDDCLPAPRWLESLLAPYRRSEVAGVGGSVAAARADTLVQRYLAEHNPLAPLEADLASRTTLAWRLILHLRRMWSVVVPDRPRPVFSLAGANMSFRKDVLDAVGGFDPAVRFGSDDEDICSLVRQHFPHMVLWYEPGAAVLHDYAGTIGDLWRRNVAYGRGHARRFAAGADQRWPIVFPAPLLAIASIAFALGRSRRKALWCAGLAVAMAPHGLTGVARSKRPGDLSFTPLRLIEEAAHDAGMLSGLLAARRPA